MGQQRRQLSRRDSCDNSVVPMKRLSLKEAGRLTPGYTAETQ